MTDVLRNNCGDLDTKGEVTPQPDPQGIWNCSCPTCFWLKVNWDKGPRMNERERYLVVRVTKPGPQESPKVVMRDPYFHIVGDE